MSELEFAHDEGGLLNFAVVIAENWVLIVIVPLVVGIVTYIGLVLTTPALYQSEAVLQISANEAAMLSSDSVLDDAIAASTDIAEYGGSTSRARQVLRDRLHLTKVEGTDFYQLTLLAEASPDDVQRILKAIIDSAIENSTPTDSGRQRLEAREQQVEISLEELQESLRRINQFADKSLQSGEGTSAINLGEYGNSAVSILSNIESRRAELLNIQTTLIGSISADDVIQQPTLPTSQQLGGLLNRVMFAVIAIGLFMLVLGLVRDGFRQASANPRMIDRVNRVRRAFWLKPKSV